MDFLPYDGVIAAMAKREEDIVKLMIVAPMYYQEHPDFAQFFQFVRDAETIGYTTERLYWMFCSGTLSSDIVALLKKHAQAWPPSGRIVDAEERKRLLGEVARISQETGMYD